MTQDGYDWPNGCTDERWPAIKRKPADVPIQPGQVWRCRGGGEWNMLPRNAAGEWVAQSMQPGCDYCHWVFQDNGRPAGTDPEGWGALDLIELVASAP